MHIQYIGPALDYSGYGEANRHDIAALVSAGIKVTTEIPQYTPEICEYGDLGELARSLYRKPLPYPIKIIHTTPNVYGQYLEPGKYHIGRVFWETNKLPADFASACKMVDEIWTGSEYNAEAIRNSGVNKPIYIIPEAIQTPAPDVEPYIVGHQDTFKFYSMFEWTERKNPAGLLEAYWREFENTEGVSLTIKTYVDNFEPQKRQEIDTYIRKLKDRLGLKRYAPLFLYRNLMDRRQIYRFHKTFDCFVSAHRGEGWGIPQMEAMLTGNPAISTNCGGIHEHISSMILVPYELVPLAGNSRNKQWYTDDQFWADAQLDILRQLMRMAFDDRDWSKAIGRRQQREVTEKLSIEAVGKQMRARLEEIWKHQNLK